VQRPGAAALRAIELMSGNHARAPVARQAARA